MRLTPSLLALAVFAAAAPVAAHGQDAPAPPPRVERTPPPPPNGPPPPPPAYRAAPPYPRTVPAPPRYYRPYAYGYRPHFWWGWGWGWGWYPMYGYPPPPPADGYAPRPREDADRITTRLSIYGAGRSDGFVGGVDLGLEGRFTGFDLDVNAVASEPVTGPLHEGGSDPATWGTAHFTWSFLSERSVRLRAEAGASLLGLPDSRFARDQQWRGKTVIGPDVGISGQMGLVGPLGIEGHARLTPFPVRVADTLIAATVHGGPVGLSAGWRWIDVAGDGKDAPRMSFRGPQVGLSLAF